MKLFEPALAWVPFVTHLQLLAVLWLQLPVVRAVTRLLSHLVPPLFRAWRNRAAAAAASDADPGSTPAPRPPRANALYSARLSDPALQRQQHAPAAAADECTSPIRADGGGVAGGGRTTSPKVPRRRHDVPASPLGGGSTGQ